MITGRIDYCDLCKSICSAGYELTIAVEGTRKQPIYICDECREIIKNKMKEIENAIDKATITTKNSKKHDSIVDWRIGV